MEISFRRMWPILLERSGYALVLLPFLTEFFEHGGLKLSARYYVTEGATATLIFLFVFLLGRARKRHEDLDRARKDLLQLIVHDIKNPISCTMGAINCLIQGINDGSQGQKLLNLALTSCRSGLSLVERLLEIERLETSDIEPRRETVNAGTLLSSCASEALGSAVLAEVSLSFRADPGLPDFPADPDLFKRAVMNLLENALKHTPTGGTIILGAEKRDGFARLSVSDTGTGIPLEDQAGLFGKFHRLEAMSANGRPGTGLGLYFCRLVAEAHGGRIELDSKPGKGTTVSLMIPLQFSLHRYPPAVRTAAVSLPGPRISVGRN
jgi:signal transduction histidine kinase